jgi:hypothetical protein
MTLLPTLAGIGWDPQIRGILTVIVAVLVLMGSVYLVLATDLAHRLGFLVALAAFFGWMTVHGMIWWIYPPGNGPGGRLAAWEIEDINHGDLSQSLVADARDIDTSGLPAPEELRDMTPEQLEELSAQQEDPLDGWELLGEADAARGEAQSVVDARMAEGEVPGLSTPDTYVYLYGFETGGKPDRRSDSVWDRVTNEITNSLRITHPTRYALVQLQPAIEQEAVAGQAPPTPEPDPDAEVVSVVLVRDLGQRRLPAALVAVGSGAMFGLLCAMLHARDRRVAEHRSAPLPVSTGAD